MTSASRWQSVVEELFPRALRDRLVALRRALHAEPELAFQEHRTVERLHEALSSLGARDIRRVTETGLVLRIPGRDRSAPTVAIRGDIDALPIQEQTGLPYASLVPGVMHACGHDVHATWATGAAALLLAEPAHGDVVVLLQPAEETGNGAARMIEAGALDTVAMIFGGHVDRRFPVGQIVADSGPLAASADSFEIVLNGRGAHAARPHESVDPVVAAAALITTVQQIVARRLNPADAGVLTVATIHAGIASNVIPESARITGTIRAVRAEARALLRRELERITAGIAMAHDLAAAVEFSEGTPPLVNTDDATGFAREAVT
ncbi:MAG: M20 family metallopeptidase, partial [Gemmatimonadota bacterium]|nr:M20 family metallopeptidase [Gemmatimonadota bacterium]